MERIPEDEVWAQEDIEEKLKKTEEPELLRYLNLLPEQLRGRHFMALEKIAEKNRHEDPAKVAELRINYILGIVDARERAITESEMREPELQEIVSHLPHGIEGFGAHLREVLLSTGNHLGSGLTARVKSMSVDGFDPKIAVKYLLTPTAKTLSAEGEYDMLREVETVAQIERAEERLGAGEYIRVPHVYFYYKRGKLQCYGMSQVDGMTVAQLTDKEQQQTPRHEVIREALYARLASNEARAAFGKEIDVLVQAMHEVCLHGDIKTRNIMVDEKGVLYLIDFGQSVDINTMTEDTRDRFENLKDEENALMHDIARGLFNYLDRRQ